MAAHAIAALRAAFADPVQTARDAGGGMVRTLGPDVPREILLAAGLTPVRLVPDPAAATPMADTLVGGESLGWRGRALLETLLADAERRPLIMSHADAEQPQLFAALRELSRLGDADLGPVHFVDLLATDREATLAYNRGRLADLVAWSGEFAGARPTTAAIAEAITQTNRQRRLLGRIAWLRREVPARLTGGDALALIGAASLLPITDHCARLADVIGGYAGLPPRDGPRLLLSGGAHESAWLYDRIEALGVSIVGEDHVWGDPWHERLVDEGGDVLTALARHGIRPASGPMSRTADRAQGLAARIGTCRPDLILHLSWRGEASDPWDLPRFRQVAAETGTPLLALQVSPSGSDADAALARIGAFLDGRSSDEPTAIRAPAPTTPATPDGTARPRAEVPRRSRKSLQSVADFGAFQRDWFASVRARAEAGEPFAVVGANSPQEMLRALDVPFVVNQWWASIVAAKQQSTRYFGLLRAHGYPSDIESYSAQGLAAAFDHDPDLAPWGGLPRPTHVQAVNGSDATARLYEAWAWETGGDLDVLERSIESRWELSPTWWNDLHDGWDTALEPERLDLMVAELRGIIAKLESATGRVFDNARFAEVMSLVNEQETYYLKTRDLIANARPAPVGIVDTMPATMVPQWHRGTIWGRDAARAFYEEVASRAAAGEAACPGERIRLMWVGRGLWSDMAFYQRWEESHGAVFVWSMYLALAADGYIRNIAPGQDPLRALAARFVTMGDELRMPTWAGAWHVKEAVSHGVDGAVALSDADPFVIRALERSGIPVLALDMDNFNRAAGEEDTVLARITTFIEGPAAAQARRRAR